MKKHILILMLGMVLISCVSAHQTYYRLDLNYSYEDIDISNLDIELSEDLVYSYGDYFVEVVGYEVLNMTFFDVPNKILWDGVDEETGEISFGGEDILDEVDFEIYVPYYENAKEIIIYDGDLNELDRIDVSMFSRDYREVSEEEIEKVEKKNVSEGEIVRPEKKVSEEKVSYIEMAKKYWWVLVIVFVVLLLKLIWDLSAKKKNMKYLRRT